MPVVTDDMIEQGRRVKVLDLQPGEKIVCVREFRPDPIFRLGHVYTVEERRSGVHYPTRDNMIHPDYGSISLFVRLEDKPVPLVKNFREFMGVFDRG